MRFLLSHRHEAGECGIAYAAWKGFDSPLRDHPALASCVGERLGADRHLVIWMVEAESRQEALKLLPGWLAARSDARRVEEVRLP